MGPAKTVGECLQSRNANNGFVESLAKALDGGYSNAHTGKGAWTRGYRKAVHLLEFELVLIEQEVDQIKYFLCVLKGHLHHQCSDHFPVSA